MAIRDYNKTVDLIDAILMFIIQFIVSTMISDHKRGENLQISMKNKMT